MKNILVIIILISPLCSIDTAKSEFNNSYTFEDYDRDVGIERISNKILYVSYFKIDKCELYKLASSIYKYSTKNKLITEDWLISVGAHESGFNKYAIGLIGERGYFQINVEVHDVDMEKIYNADYQVMFAYSLLVEKLYKYKNIQLALNGYNGWASYKNKYASKVFAVKTKIKEMEIENV